MGFGGMMGSLLFPHLSAFRGRDFLLNCLGTRLASETFRGRSINHSGSLSAESERSQSDPIIPPNRHNP